MTESIIHGNQNTTKLINQMKASAAQYPILSKEDEHAMIEANRNDRDKLNQLLFMHNVRIVFNQAKRYMSRTRDYDGLVQNGMIGLMVAAKRFDLDRNIKFCTHATVWVKKHMTMPYYSSQFKIDKNTISINAKTGMREDQSLSADETFENCLSKYIDPAYGSGEITIDASLSATEQSAICAKLYEAMNSDTSLSATDRAVFTDIFVEHEKTRDIADKYGIDMSDVSEIRHRILGKFKNLLESRHRIGSYADVS